MSIVLLAILVISSVSLIAYALWPKDGMDENALRRRMMGRKTIDDVGEIQKKAKRSAAEAVLERMAPLATRGTTPMDAQAVSMLRVKLSNAGFRRENTPTLFLASKTLLGVGMAIVALVWLLAAGKPFNDVMLWTCGAGGVGFMAPNYWLSVATRTRGDKIRNGLPDSMDLLVISVESGLALDSAIQRVGEEMSHVHPELAEEMQIVTHEGAMGIPRSEALSNMAMRTGVPEIKSLVAVVTQAERFGTSVAKALRNQADALRVKRRQRAEEAAQKTTVKLMLPLILFIFPAIFVVLVGPAVLQLMDTFGNM